MSNGQFFQIQISEEEQIENGMEAAQPFDPTGTILEAHDNPYASFDLEEISL